MINNRQASEKLNINLAKWKRWSREFLSPDPTAGMQAGYAREYTLEECFTVHLGGHLVSSLKFSVPDTRKILRSLTPWMKKKSILPLENYRKRVLKNQDAGPSWGIAISVNDGIVMFAKGIIKTEIIQSSKYDGPGTVFLEQYISELIGSGTFDPGASRTLDITMFVFRFLHAIAA